MAEQKKQRIRLLSGSVGGANNRILLLLLLGLGSFAAYRFHLIPGLDSFLGSRQPIAESPSCKPGVQVERVGLRYTELAELLTGHLTAAVEIADQHCFRPGPAGIDFIFPMDRGMELRQETHGTVLIKGIDLIAVDHWRFEDARSVGFSNASKFESYVAYLRQQHAMKVQVLHFSLEKPPEFDINRSLPPVLTHAQALSAPELEDLKTGAMIIDIRAPSDFSKHHRDKAANIPYEISDEGLGWRSRTVKADLFLKEDRFPIQQLPADKNTTLVFYGEDSSDIRPVRASVFADKAGYHNLRWLRDGDAELRGEQAATPEELTGIRRIEFDDLSKLAASAETSVFAVNLPNKWVSEMPMSAKALELAFPSHLRGSHSHDATELARALSEGSHALLSSLPTNKEAQVVFIGTDSLDWAPLGAAALARQAGWKNVFWYRAGALDLNYRKLLKPKSG